MVKVTGGDKFIAAVKEAASKLSKNATLRVGFLEGSTYPDGTSVPTVTAIQEFGAPSRNIPPRPYFRSMIADKSPEWPEAIAKLLKATNYDVALTLDMAGEQIAGQLQDSIIALNSPPLSAITVMLRDMKHHNPNLIVTGKTVGEAAARVAAGKTNYGASTKPLEDTGVLLAAVAHEVKSGE